MTGPTHKTWNTIIEPKGWMSDPLMSALIADLSSGDGLVRQRARARLVKMGESTVGPLTRALGDTDGQVRWEAAKALGEIGAVAVSSAPALVNTLEDRRRDVRWLAAEALVALGRPGLVPLLEAVVRRSASVWLREGAHHVLHGLAGGELEEIVSPVLAALEGAEPALVAPEVARRALEALGGE